MESRRLGVPASRRLGVRAGTNSQAGPQEIAKSRIMAFFIRRGPAIMHRGDCLHATTTNGQKIMYTYGCCRFLKSNQVFIMIFCVAHMRKGAFPQAPAGPARACDNAPGMVGIWQRFREPWRRMGALRQWVMNDALSRFSVRKAGPWSGFGGAQ